ncbi:MAG: hypothetical protein ACMUJM_21195 [bacterium]
MQEDFDRIRLDHILIINNLVEKFKIKTGYYPLEKRFESLPIAVMIASDTQLENDKGRTPIHIDLFTRGIDGKVPPQPKHIETISVQELTEELEQGLQIAVKLPVDPQNVPINKPSVYLYTYYLGVFDVSAFLHHEFSFSRPLGKFYNKITLSNRANLKYGIWTAEGLLQNEDFINFINTPFNKPGYEQKFKPDNLSKVKSQIAFKELYLKYDQATKNGELILYSLQTDEEMTDKEIIEFSQRIVYLAEKTALCEKYFKIRSFIATEESFYKDRDFVKLVIRFENKQSEVDFIEELFSTILKIEAITYYDKKDKNIILTHFSYNQKLYLESHEKMSVKLLHKQNEGKREYLLGWEKKKGPFEFVLGGLFNDDNVKSLYPYFINLFKEVDASMK